jgi:hypothetical protein
LADTAVQKARQLEKEGPKEQAILLRELAAEIRSMGIPIKFIREKKLVSVPEELING